MRSYQLKFYFSVCLLLICFAPLRAQQDSIKEHENLYKKNTIHGSLGTLYQASRLIYFMTEYYPKAKMDTNSVR